MTATSASVKECEPGAAATSRSMTGAEDDRCSNSDLRHFEFVVVGGGIAAVSCAEEIAALKPSSSIAILTASSLVKVVSNLQKIGRGMETFDVKEQLPENVFSSFPNIAVFAAPIAKLDCQSKVIIESECGKRFHFDRLCIATGGKPKVFSQSPFVIGIRDTETVKEFQRKLQRASRVVIVGNGGIATELVYALEKLEIVWVIRHQSIVATFVDAGAAEFFLPHLRVRKEKDSRAPLRRPKYACSDVDNPDIASSSTSARQGSALGPDWLVDLRIKGQLDERRVHIELQCEVERVVTAEEMRLSPSTSKPAVPPNFTEAGSHCLYVKVILTNGKTFKGQWPVYCILTNGTVFGCDLIVSATGVVPNTDVWLKSDRTFNVAADGGLLVNAQMQTNVSECIYAAGDVCTAGWSWHPHWLQMRLWSQARQMGAYAGRCMVSHSENTSMDLDICFEIFTHVTNFFGFKVILLGKFNAQNLGGDYEALLRVSNDEFVKIIIGHDGRAHGAILIGETDLEETLEHLILNQTDLSQIKDDLLNPSVDIEDYFD